jgi:hypothetical protein
MAGPEGCDRQGEERDINTRSLAFEDKPNYLYLAAKIQTRMPDEYLYNNVYKLNTTLSTLTRAKKRKEI